MPMKDIVTCVLTLNVKDIMKLFLAVIVTYIIVTLCSGGDY